MKHQRPAFPHSWSQVIVIRWDFSSSLQGTLTVSHNIRRFEQWVVLKLVFNVIYIKMN